MDEEQRKWQKQFNSNFGAKEFLRFMAAFMAWIFLGGALDIILGSVAIFIVFFFLIFVFAFVCTTWKPAYSLLRMILGNKNLPTEPMPRALTKSPTQKLPWYGYLSGIWFSILVLILFYLAFKLFTK